MMKKFLKIALIAPQPFVENRGTPIANLRLARVLADAGHEVHVITYPFGSVSEYPGIKVHRCSPVPFVRRLRIGLSTAKILLDANVFLTTARLIRSGFDCIHGVEEGALIGCVFGMRLGIPLVYDMDSILSSEIGASPIGMLPGVGAAARAIERRVIRSSAVVVTVSDQMAEVVRRIEPDKPVVVAPDIPLDTPVEPDPDRAYAALPPTARRGGLVLYAGSFAGYQGLDLLLGAMEQVTAQAPEASLVLIGGDPSEIRRLRKKTTTTRTTDRVCFLGKKSPDDIPDFLAAADILVSPRRCGVNLPAKIATYMKSGTPILATDIPAHRALLDDESAVLVEPTTAGLAEGILWMLSHPVESRRKSERAREKASSLTPELFARRVLEAYEVVESLEH